MKDLKFGFYLFRPNKTLGQRNYSTDQCRAVVWENMWNHQCSRKPKYKAGDVGLCTQHAKLVAKHNDMELSDFDSWVL